MDIFVFSTFKLWFKLCIYHPLEWQMLWSLKCFILMYVNVLLAHDSKKAILFCNLFLMKVASLWKSFTIINFVLYNMLSKASEVFRVSKVFANIRTCLHIHFLLINSIWNTLFRVCKLCVPGSLGSEKTVTGKSALGKKIKEREIGSGTQLNSFPVF